MQHWKRAVRLDRIYNIFDTQRLLSRPPEVVITDKSGSDGVYLWVNTFLNLHGNNAIKKTRMVKIMRWVADQYEKDNRTTAISDREMAQLVKTYLPEEYKAAEAGGRLVYMHHDE